MKRLIFFILKKLLHPNKIAKIQGVRFGKNCNFGNINFGSEPNFIKIGDNFYSSSNVQFITHDGSVNVIRNLYSEYKNIDLFNPFLVGNNVFIGFGVTILPGTEICDNVIIGSGSIVKRKLKANSIYAGVPAKFICTIDEYLEKNKEKFIFTKHLPNEEKKFLLTIGLNKILKNSMTRSW